MMASTKVITLCISILVLSLMVIAGYNFLFLMFKDTNPKMENMNISFSIEGEDIEGDLALSVWEITILIIIGVLVIITILIIFFIIKEMMGL